jgi:hypothetical protein
MIRDGTDSAFMTGGRLNGCAADSLKTIKLCAWRIKNHGWRSVFEPIFPI